MQRQNHHLAFRNLQQCLENGVQSFRLVSIVVAMNGAKYVVNASKPFFIKNLRFFVGNVCKMLAVVVHHVAAMIYSRIIDGEFALIIRIKPLVNKVF